MLSEMFQRNREMNLGPRHSGELILLGLLCVASGMVGFALAMILGS